MLKLPWHPNIDTGPLIAFYSQQDSYYASCRGLMDSVPFGKAYTCWPVITEAAYMLRRRPEQRDDLLQAVIAGDLIIQQLRERDLDLADACLFHLADREQINAVFTLDRRHFGMFRKQNGNRLGLLLVVGLEKTIDRTGWEVLVAYLAHRHMGATLRKLTQPFGLTDAESVSILIRRAEKALAKSPKQETAAQAIIRRIGK